MNYCSFAHSDVSYRFKGENDNVVLEFMIIERNILSVLHKTSGCYLEGPQWVPTALYFYGEAKLSFEYCKIPVPK